MEKRRPCESPEGRAFAYFHLRHLLNATVGKGDILRLLTIRVLRVTTAPLWSGWARRSISPPGIRRTSRSLGRWTCVGGGHSGREEETGMTGLRVGTRVRRSPSGEGEAFDLRRCYHPVGEGAGRPLRCGRADQCRWMDAPLALPVWTISGDCSRTATMLFLNIPSLTLLERVMKALTEQGWQVVNIDATLVAQGSKIAPYRQEMLCAGPDAGYPAGAGERQGHHGGASGLHRRGTGDIRPRRGADPAGGELIRKR